MITPVAPRIRSPLTQFTMSPRSCVAIIATASLHPHRRCRNQPIPAAVRAAASSRNGIPTLAPRGASSLCATGFRDQRRSRTVPCQSKVVAARHDIMAPKNRKTPMKENPGRSGPWLSCIWPIYPRSGGSSMVGEPAASPSTSPLRLRSGQALTGQPGRLSLREHVSSRGGCRSRPSIGPGE